VRYISLDAVEVPPDTAHKPMHARIFRKATQTKRFVVLGPGTSGWEVREEQDSKLIRSVRYDDWHRVERALMNFALEATECGWVEA
jgi:hypothetical protein